MKKLQYLVSTILISTLIACGGGTEKKAENETTNQEEVVTSEEKQETINEEERNEVEITVIAKGNTMTEITFDPTSITLQEGDKVTVTLKNESESAGMLHNFVLVPQGAGEEIATAAITAAASDYVPEDDRIIVASEMTNLGETVTFEFIAPAKGSYHYICTYPGHYPKMVGRLTVN